MRLPPYHEEDLPVSTDAIPATGGRGFHRSDLPLPGGGPDRALLKPGATVTMAAHCHQTTGGRSPDIGLAPVVPAAD